MVDLTPGTRRLGDLVARVCDDELSRPTPCPAYTLGDLIEHVGGLALAFRAAADKDIASPYVNGTPSGDAARLPADWRERIPADLAALAGAWAKPDAWTGMTRIANQDAPAEMVGVTVADELVVHGWDVAQATRPPGDPRKRHSRPARRPGRLCDDLSAPGGAVPGIAQRQWRPAMNPGRIKGKRGKAGK